MTIEPTYVQTAQEPAQSARSGAVPARRGRQVWRACHEVGRHVAEARGVTPAELFGTNRSRAKVAAARQVAMYLSHTLLSATMTEVGRVFGRDRKTVSHACAAVEDMRDDKAVDEELAVLERVIKEALVVARMHPGRAREARHARH